MNLKCYVDSLFVNMVKMHDGSVVIYAEMCVISIKFLSRYICLQMDDL